MEICPHYDKISLVGAVLNRAYGKFGFRCIARGTRSHARVETCEGPRATVTPNREARFKTAQYCSEPYLSDCQKTALICDVYLMIPHSFYFCKLK